MDGHIGFHAAVRRSYNTFIKELSKQCKQLVRHHLDSVTSTYSRLCYESEMLGAFNSGATSVPRLFHMPASSFILDLSEGSSPQEEPHGASQENINPNSHQQSTPARRNEARGALRESQLTVPETPSPDQASDPSCGIKKEPGDFVEIGGRKRQARVVAAGKRPDFGRNLHGGVLFGAEVGSRPGSAYSEICQLAVQHFSYIREVLIERNVPSTLNSGLLTPWYVLTHQSD